MSVFDALRHLSVYLRETHPTNHLADLYELVQYAGNIVPRLYLMITVGTVYMGIAEAPVKEIMKDMMEMSRGVQHPVRGLFLRYYLSGQARDFLPEGTGDGPEGNLQDSIGFILTNFVEMNKLWVRLQHQGPSRERDQRTRERQELQLLVGSNLVRLSQLVDLETYKEVILQPLLEQVVQCRDVLAQEYLLEVITQVFPDEFHLHTLDKLLAATARLNPHANIKGIIIGLMDRLSAYSQRETDTQTPEQKQKQEADSVAALLEKLKMDKEEPSEPVQPAEDGQTSADVKTDDEASASNPPGESSEASDSQAQTNGEAGNHRGIPHEVKLFEIFYDQVMHIVGLQRLPIQDITALLVSLANLALNIYPERLDYIDQVLSYGAREVSRFTNSADLHSPTTQSNVLSLLLSPIKTYHSLFTALALPNFAPLYQQQTHSTRRSLAGEVARNLLRNETKITSSEHLEGILPIIAVLIKEGLQQSPAYSGGPVRRNVIETEESIEEQGWIARIVHLIKAPDNTTQFQLLQRARQALAEGNERTRYTTPALLTQSLKLARAYKRREHLSTDDFSTQSSALYKFMHSTVLSLYNRVSGPGVPDLCLRLFVSCGQVACQCENEDVAYEYYAQAFTIYEESISDSRSQFQAICIIAGALSTCAHRFGSDNFDTLITKAALHGSKLLKKPDQCRAVYLASHLWWTVEKTEGADKAEDGTEVSRSDRLRSEASNKPLQPYRDGKRVLECLQRALRVADACMDTGVSVELFVEILNRYVYYFDQENDAVTTKYLNGLIELIHSNLNTTDNASGLENPRRHFERTLEYIRSREYEGVETRPK